jgi:hypothetical protein
MLNLMTVWQAWINPRYCGSIPVLSAADLKKSLTCSRKRGSPLISRPGPATLGIAVAAAPVAVENGLATTLQTYCVERKNLRFVRRAALLKLASDYILVSFCKIITLID